MSSKNDITNLVSVESSDSAQKEAAFAALRKLAEEQFAPVRSAGDFQISFATSWEPPFKAIKTLSSQFPEVVFTVLGDAFAKHHWISKSTIRGGKQEDVVVTRIDDEFDGIFAEVYGISYDEWEKKQSAPFAHLIKG